MVRSFRQAADSVGRLPIKLRLVHSHLVMQKEVLVSS
jgi:hypothetical protein